MNTTSLNSRERRAQRLFAHYQTCERLARYLCQANTSITSLCTRCGGYGQIEPLGGDQEIACPACAGTGDKNGGVFPQFDGKRISVQLWKAEQTAQRHAERVCSDSGYRIAEQNKELARVQAMVRKALGTLPPGFFINTDPRGYGCKIDNENPEGAVLIAAVGLQTDLGGFGLLSPTIDGSR